MGHTWLRGVPLSAKWLRVFEQLVGGTGLAADDVAELAALTADAASTALRKAAEDAGLCHAFYILALTSKATDEPGLRGNLARVGINLPDRPCLFDLTVEIQASIDDHIFRHGHPTDISEIAQQAVGEAVVEMAGDRASVFDSGSASVERSLESVASQTGFGRLGQLFFGRFAARFLNFYLSRITAEYVGSARIPSFPNYQGSTTRFDCIVSTAPQPSWMPVNAGMSPHPKPVMPLLKQPRGSFQRRWTSWSVS